MSGERNIIFPDGEVVASSITMDESDYRLNNLSGCYLGVILSVYEADRSRNILSSRYTDRRSYLHTADVLLINDGYNNTPSVIPQVAILPVGPSGIDNYIESLPRGSSVYIGSESFDISVREGDPFDLDGDWCVVSFIGGNVNIPYVSNWWPNPRNVYDPQTSGQGNPDSQGSGTTLGQSGRHFSRSNGVEHVITASGDVYFSTYFAGSYLDTQADPLHGRFGRQLATDGGGVRVTIKPTQPLELTWNDQEDGIGLNNTHDPQLPQTNPPPVQPFAQQPITNTYIRITSGGASLSIPNLFSTITRDIYLEASRDFDIIVGQRLGINVSDFMELSVVNNMTTTISSGDYNLTVDNGNIEIEATEGQASLTTNDSLTLISQTDDIILTAEQQNITLTAQQSIDLFSQSTINLSAVGAMSLSAQSFSMIPSSVGTGALGLGAGDQEPVLLGETYTNAEAEFLLALNVWASAVSSAIGGTFTTVPPATTTFLDALNTFLSGLSESFSTDVTVS